MALSPRSGSAIPREARPAASVSPALEAAFFVTERRVVGDEGSGGSREIELKLALDPADAVRVRHHPLLEASSSPAEERDLVSTYFDTDDLILRRKGVYLRVRACGDRYIQAVKAEGKHADLLERAEWEQEVSGREPDVDALGGTALEPFLTAGVLSSLRPQFETRIRRTLYRIERDGSEVEIAIDRGEIATRERTIPVSELELELKRGQTAELFRLARALSEKIPLRLAVKTKAERGFELLEGGGYAVQRAKPIEITPSMTSADAFRTIARSCLRQVIANEPGMYAGQAEALHQMRIGLRRLRAVTLLFKDVVAGDELNRTKAELQWITKELGPARDLDVFGEEVLKPLREAHPDHAELAATQRDFEERRDHAYRHAAGSVRSDRCRSAVLDLIEWIETGTWASTDDKKRQALRSRPIAEHAEEELRRLRKRIKRRGAHLRDLSVRQRHRLRIRAKRLRYATEFFAGTFSGKKAAKRREKSLAALKDLQDTLGGLNDLAMRPELTDVGAGVAAPRQLGDASSHADKLLDAAENAYERFADTKPFWKG